MKKYNIKIRRTIFLPLIIFMNNIPIFAKSKIFLSLRVQTQTKTIILVKKYFNCSKNLHLNKKIQDVYKHIAITKFYNNMGAVL